jgi:hypothetical protein
MLISIQNPEVSDTTGVEQNYKSLLQNKKHQIKQYGSELFI